MLLNLEVDPLPEVPDEDVSEVRHEDVPVHLLFVHPVHEVYHPLHHQKELFVHLLGLGLPNLRLGHYIDHAQRLACGPEHVIDQVSSVQKP